jgi:hypothetical protein
MKRETGLRSDENAAAVQVAIPAVRRKSLAASGPAAYSAHIDNEHRTRGPTMNNQATTSLRTRIAAFFGAVITSALVLGSTVAGMQPRDDAASSLIALQRAAANATSVR